MTIDSTWPPGAQSLTERATCMLSHFSHARLVATPWTVAHQAPLYMGFSRKEYWSGLPFPFPEDLPNPRIKPMSLRSPALASEFFTTITTRHRRINTGPIIRGVIEI